MYWIYKRKKLNPDVFISFIFILPEYRSAGYGRKLLNIILNRYKNVALGTDEQTSNMALKLYKSLGFKIIKKESNKSCYWYKY